MNKYLYAECFQDYWPEIKTIVAPSYDDAIEKLVEKYANQFEDYKISEFDNMQDLSEYLNDTYTLAISDLTDIEEI